MKILVSSCFFAALFISQFTNAQTPGVTDIGVGYFNNHQFATYGTISGTPPTLTGSLAGNPFTINFSNNTRSVLNFLSNYGPNRPANSGAFSTTCISVNYTSVPATSTITFNNLLEPLDQIHVIDVENGESMTIEFLDASNNLVTLDGNVRVVSISTISPTASLNYPSPTMVGVNTNPGRTTSGNSAQGFSFVMLTNVVKTIRFTQTSPNTGAGSWDFTLSRGTPDRGDAPSSYGDATHLSLAARLKFGANGGDAEGSVFSGTNASGDDAVSGSTIIDDEDGISSIPAISNSGPPGQVIASYSVSATVTNSIGAGANVMAWADWNGDDVFDASEAATAAAVPTGSTNVSRTFSWNNFTLNGSSGRTGTYLRIRTTTGPLTASDASGFAPDGEAEDYFVPFAVALPVTFGEFNVSALNNRSVLLHWETLTEYNNLGFEVQHSTDGKNWQNLGFVKTKANGADNTAKLQYSFTHTTPPSGNNYYRLEQTDLDGKTSYSNIRTINMSGATQEIIVAPNPARDEITIKGIKPGDLILMYNVTGQPLDIRKATTTQARLSISSFPKGQYSIIIKAANGETKSFKVLKQ